MSLSPWQLCFRADLKCRVRACNNRRIVDGAGDSPFCRYHVCTVCFKFRTCAKRGHGEERICNHHRRCEYVIEGRRCRSWRKHHDFNFRYCVEEHGCTHKDCKEPRSRKNSSSPFCSKHGCNVKGCDQPRQGRGRCCKRHTCRDRGCTNCVYHRENCNHDDNGDDDDDSDSKPSSSSPTCDTSPPTHCRGHQICEVESCRSFVLLDDECHRAAKFCHRHFCTASPTCAQARLDGPGASTCRDHSCGLYPRCTNPRAEGLFCSDHECHEPGCVKQRYESGGRGTGGGGGGGPWCADHMCMAALARQEDCEARREGSSRNPVYCVDHEPCEEAGCNAFRAVRGRGARLAKCEEHLAAAAAPPPDKPKCVVPHCTLEAEGNGIVACKTHKCRVVGCQATASMLSTIYCDAHRCAEVGCTNPHVAVMSMHLSVHSSMLPLTGAHGAGGLYCTEHSFRGHCGHSRHRRGSCRHGPKFGGDGPFGGCGCGCGWCGTDDDDDDSKCSGDTVPDHGGGGGGGGCSCGGSVGVEIAGCICCSGGSGGGGVGDGCGGGKKHH